MDFLNVTKQYYACWLDVEASLLDRPGVYLVSSPNRGQRQAGYASPYAIYAYCTKETTIISCRPDLVDSLRGLTAQLAAGMDAEQVKGIMAAYTGKQISHNRKYVFGGALFSPKASRALTVDDYGLYLAFFRATHPDCSDVSWVKDYFAEIVARNLCHGVIMDGVLASATDAPDVPYMQGRVQELGINTHPAYRGRGYAKEACAACISALIEQNIVPLWSCTHTNRASDRLAKAVGFQNLADILSISG